MKTFFRRLPALGGLLAALVAAPLAHAAVPSSVVITAPANGQNLGIVTSPAGVDISATANSSGPGATIVLLDFRVNNTSIGTVAGGGAVVNGTVKWMPTALGTYTLTVIATDSSAQTANTATSPAAVVTVDAARVATVIAPAANTTVAQNSSLILRSTASMSDGVVSQVDFLLDGVTPLGTTATSAPYNTAATITAATGAHTIVARATASNGTTTFDSLPISITVAPPVGTAPTVSITAPTAGATISVGGNVTITATASDADGFIPNTAPGGVTFYADGEPIGTTDLTAPYSITWTPTVAKTYSLRALATDDKNNTTLSDAVTVNAIVSSAATVSLTSPTAGRITSVGAPVSLAANATPSTGATITAVEFLAGSTVVATTSTAPFTATWTPTNQATTSLTARVIDSLGGTATSAPVSITVAAAPNVSLASPGSPLLPTGTPVTLSATASVGTGLTIAGVQFLVNGVAIGTDADAPYTTSWTPSTAGSVALSARVIDSAGASVTSNPFNVTVTGTSTLSVTLALTGSSSIPVGSTRVLTATASGSATIDRVELLLNGISPVATDTSAPYNFLFTAPTATGAQFLVARVVDSTGNEATSTPVPITVTNSVGSAPTVSIVAPASGSFLAAGTQATISGTAADQDGSIASVQVLVNGATTGLANNGLATLSGGAWSITWTPAGSGVASISAIATDNQGNSVASPAVGVNLTDSSSPGIVVDLSPGPSRPALATLPSGAVRNVLATVTPATGRAVVRVEFFVDGTKVGEDTTPPYTHRYVAPALAPDEQSKTFLLTARATDNAGAARDAQQPVLVVTPVGQPPTVNLLTPANNASVTPGTDVNVAATAVSSGGTIASVHFYVNGDPTPIAAAGDTSAPYTQVFRPTAPGSYTIDAIATDDRGNTSVSNAATIIAAFATPTVIITSPNPAATARATPNVPLTLTATAVAQAGTGAAVLLVEFLLDDVQIGADTTAPYTFAWTPTTAQLGQHVIRARVTDTNGQTATSAPLNVNVANVVGTPPTVSITQPSIGTGVGQTGNLQSLSTVNFVANAASAAVGGRITSVEFFVNEVSIGTATREQETNLYRLSYDLSRLDLSSAQSTTDPNTGAVRYTVPLYAIARDNNNNQTVTNPINLTINTSTSLPPSVQIQATSGNTVTVGTGFLVAPTFADPDGTVTQIQMFANGVAAGAPITNPQPQISFLTFTPTTAGRYNMYLVATDDTGNTAVSTPSFLLTVNAVAAPATTITRPSDDSTTTTVNAPVFLEGTATSSDPALTPTLVFLATAGSGQQATITGQRIGNTAQYRAVWTPFTPGTYTLQTRANIGNAAQSTSTVSRRVVVTNLQGLAPAVTINVPGSVTTASQSNFTATANDSDGSVVEVEFFVNRESVGKAVRDDLANTWRLTARFAGVQPGTAEVVALARDSSGNVAASPTTTITVTAASSIAPSVAITPSTTNAAFNRQVQLRANARDTDGTVTSVQYFANATSLGTSTNSGTNYQVNWTPNQSGTFKVWALATDNTGITTIADTIEIVVRRNNPVLEDAAFILQTYQDIANTTTINPLVFDDIDARLGAGALTRAEVVTSLLNEPGFLPPVQLLATYYVLMGHWPTPQNYSTLVTTARGSLANAAGNILSSPEYFAKYGVVPTVALLNNPASTIPADTFIQRLWTNAGYTPTPTAAAANLAFRNNTTATATLGRGYNPAGINAAIAEFITNTNSTNTALLRRARTAALFYQLIRPPVGTSVDDITARINALLQLPDDRAVADALVKDTLYRYRYVTITKHPTSLTVAPRSGVLFSVEAEGAPPLSYQWLLNGAPIPGATGSLLSLTDVDASRVGTYTAVITSAVATATSDPATLTLSSSPTRLGNISTRGVTTGAGENVLIGGFVVAGANAQQSRQMLIRVVGPRLAAAPFNLTGAMTDPRLEVYSGGNATPVLTNDNWGTQTGGAAAVTALQQATNRAGAFAFANNSGDAAVLATLPPGPYTVQAKGPPNAPNATGIVLIEVYDVTANAAAPGKAVNVATRGLVGTGSNVLIAGFVVNGAVARRVLVRGVGPTLSRFEVGGVLADPQITLTDQSTNRVVKTNNDWATGDDAAIIASAASSAGAFALNNGSRDAAMVVMLTPGPYTVQLSGVNNTTGVAMVEVYDVDP